MRIRWSTVLPVSVIAVCVTTAAIVLIGPFPRPVPEIVVPSTGAPSAPSTELSGVGTVAFSNLLRDRGREVNIAVAGDASGKTLGAWLYLAAQAMGQTFERSVEIRDWRRTAAGTVYSPPVRPWSVDGTRPVTIWNASTALSIDYFIATVGRWLPAVRPLDLVLVSNGSVVAGSELARRSITLMRSISELRPRSTVVAIVQPTAPSEQARIGETTPADDLRLSARVNGFQYIDVDSAFAGAGSENALLQNGTSTPTASGNRLWSQTVVTALSSGIEVDG